jgi:predicted aldo/keto reductase-like oxidoreductase
MEPLRGGILANPPQKAQAIIDQADVRRTPAEWALRWVWNHPEVSIVLSGMTTMEQVVENIKTAREAQADSLTEKEKAIVDGMKKLFKEKVKVNCTGCAYCMPCPAGINIPMCFSIYNDYWVFDCTPKAKKMYGFWSKIATPASKCVECGRCEGHCSQSIEIRKELRNVKELFE